MAVRLSVDALADLEGIHAYIMKTDGEAAADRILDELLKVAERLSRFPDRGSYPDELLAVGVRRYRQLMVGSHRLIYRVDEDHVLVMVIADGRRDMQTLLTERLLRGPSNSIARIKAAADLAAEGGSEPQLRSVPRRRPREDG